MSRRRRRRPQPRYRPDPFRASPLFCTLGLVRDLFDVFQAHEREEQLKKEVDELQRKCDNATATASAAAAAPSAVIDTLIDGGDEEQKRQRRLKEKAEQKLQKLQEETDQQAAAANAAAPSSGDVCRICHIFALSSLVTLRRLAGVSPPPNIKIKKRNISGAVPSAPPANGISLSDIRQ
jgi:hypothetical protein